MENLLIFIIGVAAVVAVVIWLYRANKGDLQALGKQLGLSPPAERTQERIQERGAGWQSKELEGMFNGQPLQIWQRSVRYSPQRRQEKVNIYTMVVRPVTAGVSLPQISVEPRLRGGLLDWRFGDMPEADLGDDEFRSSFRVATADGTWAARLFDAEVRAAILDLRKRWVGGQSGGLTALADATGFGWIEIDARRIAFLIPGTPMPSLAPKITDAATVLDRIARRIEDSDA
ncbi:MAG: hypothetical protein RMN52_13940 [Anaerolineae bacterium]|nr:hypothetical protein [Candidatus Roseilinea sp.]MDW8451095.1 hypothetical protein [Anaerolineae bacterium]